MGFVVLYYLFFFGFPFVLFTGQGGCEGAGGGVPIAFGRLLLEVFMEFTSKLYYGPAMGGLVYDQMAGWLVYSGGVRV